VARRSLVVPAFVVGAWLAAPVAAWRLGSALGAMLEPALAETSSARGLVLGLCVAGASLGAAFGVALPGPGALGRQVEAAPVARRALVLAATLPAAAGAFVLVTPNLAAVVLPLAAETPGGWASGVSLLVSISSAAIAGATLAEAALRLIRRGSPRPGAAGLVGAFLLSVVAVESGARGLTGDGLAIALAAVTVGGAGLCAGGWLALASTRPAPARRRRRAPLTTTYRRPAPAVLALACALLARSGELRLVLLSAAAFGVVGIGVGTAAGAPPAAGVLLGGGSCAIASCFVPLSVRGRIDPGAWLWRVARCSLLAAAWAAASLTLVAISLLPVQLVALARTTDTAGAAAQVSALAVLAWASALSAGALVPRRACGAGDDALSLAVFAAVAIAFGMAVTGAGARLDAIGVPGAVAVGLTLATASVTAVAVLAAMVRRP
jgi:hypothetical protein